MHDITNAAPTAVIPTSAPRFGMRFPKRRIVTKDRTMSNGITQAWEMSHGAAISAFSVVVSTASLYIVMKSALQLLGLIKVRAAEITEQEENDRETYANLGSSNRDHEENKDLPARIF